MPSITVAISDTFQPLIDFSKYRITYFNIEIENFEGPFLVFTFGDPVGSPIEIRVPNQCAVTRDHRALKGVLHGKCLDPGGSANVTITIW